MIELKNANETKLGSSEIHIGSQTQRCRYLVSSKNKTERDQSRVIKFDSVTLVSFGDKTRLNFENVSLASNLLGTYKETKPREFDDV